MGLFRCIFLIVALSGQAQAENIWEVNPDFAGDDAPYQISGASCGDTTCLAVNDETGWAQAFSLSQGRITPKHPIDLLAEDTEIDAEAVAHADGVFYIAGSHGLSRKSNTFRPAQFMVFRIDRTTVTSTDRLRSVIQDMPDLAPFAERPLSSNGVNIEGLAVVGDRMFFGFRGPSVQGNAFVLDVSTAEVFAKGPPTARLHTLPLGQRIGIRDMARVDDGVLILSGPVHTLPRMYQIVRWTPACGVTEPLLTLPDHPKGNPEGILLLSEAQNSYTALIFYDGAHNGAPTEVSVLKSIP